MQTRGELEERLDQIGESIPKIKLEGDYRTVENLRSESREIREEIARRDGTPPPVIVGLKTADLRAVRGPYSIGA